MSKLKKRTYTFHYAKVDLGQSDIQTKVFDVWLNLVSHVRKTIKQTKGQELVYLFAWDYDKASLDPNKNEETKLIHLSFFPPTGEVSVTENMYYLFFQLNEILFHCHHAGTINVYVQEYNSFEEAYRVALSMKEVSPLCYEPSPNGL